MQNSGYEEVPTHYFERVNDYKTFGGGPEGKGMTAHAVEQVWGEVTYVPKNSRVLQKDVTFLHSEYHKNSVRVQDIEYSNVTYELNKGRSIIEDILDYLQPLEGDIPTTPVIYKNWKSYNGPLSRYKK